MLHRGKCQHKILLDSVPILIGLDLCLCVDGVSEDICVL